MNDLLSSISEPPRPLAEQLRPGTLDDVIGQSHLTGAEGPLPAWLTQKIPPSLILWGPPGCGKTTLARILAQRWAGPFAQLSAVFSGVKELRQIFERAQQGHQQGSATLLFIDEIHRFNKAQQDAFLPVVEEGSVILIGATTENPSFELNAALLSRCQVLVLKRLDEPALENLLLRCEDVLGHPLPLTPQARKMLTALADGDGRALVNLIEQIRSQQQPLTAEDLQRLLQQRAPVYDKGGEGHFNLISALHKSVRGSDPDAALYWLARMLAGGEDPDFIARRLVRMAVEDIGLAEPRALGQAMDGWQAWERLGSPEGELALAQVAVFLATAPKSVAVYRGFAAARKLAASSGSLTPPAHILNAPTALMQAQGYGVGYEYDPDCENGYSGQDYFPEGLLREQIYAPVERGFEREIKKRLTYWARLRAAQRPPSQETAP